MFTYILEELLNVQHLYEGRVLFENCLCPLFMNSTSFPLLPAILLWFAGLCIVLQQ
jgi:hypothetical protein